MTRRLWKTNGVVGWRWSLSSGLPTLPFLVLICFTHHLGNSLAFHVLIRDSQTSMSLLVPPIVSYAEFSTEIPLSRGLWSASNAVEWRAIYLDKISNLDARIPSLPRCIHDLAPLSKVNEAVDLRLAILIVLYGTWSLISEYRQLNTVMKLHHSSTPWNSGLIAASLHQEVCQLLAHFHVVASEWMPGGMPADATLVYECLLMNLHVSFEDLQLFAGKEGEDEARRVYPLLTQWATGRESRQAVWHAGQVLRAAKQYRVKDLRDFGAIALYHAALALWAKAVVEVPPKKTGSGGAGDDGNTRLERRRESTSTSTAEEKGDLVWLDGGDGPAVQRYLVLGRGTPAIRRLEGPRDGNPTSSTVGVRQRKGGNDVDGQTPALYAALSDPWAVMKIAIDILRKKSGGDVKSSTSGGGPEKGQSKKKWTCPPLVENLSRLMGSLGRAAEGMRR